MPAKTTLDVLQAALKMEGVTIHLNAYAVGLLVYEQNKYRKAQISAQNTLKKDLDKLDPSSPAYQDVLDKINAFDSQPDLGFYHTIALFSELAKTNPAVAKQMIEAVLSFDKMGRYLLDTRPIVIDGAPFVLDSALMACGVDVTAFKELATANRLNAVYLQQNIVTFKPLDEASSPFYLRGNKSNALLRNRASQVSIDFSLVSQVPTKQNVHDFLEIMVEVYRNAQFQDSSELDTLGMEVPDGAAKHRYSKVAFLQNTMSLWFMLSLQNAPTQEVLERRINFLMAVFAKANSKLPGLSSNANADLYLPFITLACIFAQSDLSLHPFVKPHLSIMHKLIKHPNALSITHYTNRIKLNDGKRKVPLSPMRMEMTTHLALGAAHAELSETSQAIKIAKENVVRGRVIYRYFHPLHPSTTLEKMSSSANEFFLAQSSVQAVFDGLDSVDVSLGIFALHKPSDGMNRQLQILESALLSQPPRIFYKSHGRLLCHEGGGALNYIEGQLTKLLENHAASSSSSSRDYTKVQENGFGILNRVKELQRLFPEDAIETISLSDDDVHKKSLCTRALLSLSLFHPHRKKSHSFSATDAEKVNLQYRYSVR